MSESPIVHGGGISAAAALYGGAPSDWIDLSTGINPCPPPLPPIPPAAWQRLPDEHLVKAARAAAQRFYRAENCLPLPVPGTQSVIQLLPALSKASRAAILSPTYGEYGRVLRTCGISVDAVRSLDNVTPAHGLVVVVNPNNPDGRRHAPEDLLELHARMQTWGGILVIDEAFGDTRPEGSVANHAGMLPGLLVFRSFGKFFGLAGLRLGFVLGEERLHAEIADRLGPWAVSGPALAIAEALLSSDTATIRNDILLRKQALDSVLMQGGLTIAGGSDLFTLVHVADVAAVHETLCRHHILVRRFDYDPHWLRFGLTPDASADRRLAAALSSSLAA